MEKRLLLSPGTGVATFTGDARSAGTASVNIRAAGHHEKFLGVTVRP